MRKWRPAHKCIYVIPEVRGNVVGLEIILNRVLPLRKFVSQEDMLIILGGYIDGDIYGGKIIDICISIKQEYRDRAIFIRGDHEEMMLRAIEGSERDYSYWVENGGSSTIEGYLIDAKIKSSASSFPQNRLRDIIPITHINFIKSLPYYFEYEDYFFLHGGFNSNVDLKDNNPTTLAFDNTASRLYRTAYIQKRFLDVEKAIKADKIVVGTHNGGVKEPAIFQKYMMLGGTAPKSLICIDINSMESVKVKKGKSRIYKTIIKVYE